MHIADIPVEVFLDDLFPLAEVRDVLSLGSTNKLFAALCADETFWRTRCRVDFNFTGQETARQSGWENIYRGLRHPRVFVWGQRETGRFNDRWCMRDFGRAIPYPKEVKIPGSRIVSLVAGGTSFHAIDAEGSMYVWGTLHGRRPSLNGGGFAVKNGLALEPHRLLMPNPIHAVSCGRLQTMAIDSKNQIWTFVSWGRPFRLDTPMLDCTSPETTPIQVESGLSFSSILTQSGDVLVFWPSEGEIGRLSKEENASMDESGDCNAYGTEDHLIPCVTWSLRADPLRIPHIPQLESTGVSQEERSKTTTLIKIAASDYHLIGLTNKGHVLKFGDLSNEYSFDRTTRWQYLENFSELSKVAAHPAFRDENSGLQAPRSLQITHITAQFETFVAYSTGSSSIILMGDVHTNEHAQPKIIPELQNRSVISIMLGDYHYGALTADAQLLTWGNYSNGALGLGEPTLLPFGTPGGYATESELNAPLPYPGRPDPPDVASPSPVHFNHGPSPGGRRFCFAATAAGQCTGALVVCLEPEKEIYDGDPEPSLPRFGQFGHHRDEAPSGSQNQISSPSDAGALGFARRVFRIGFAGLRRVAPGT